MLTYRCSQLRVNLLSLAAGICFLCCPADHHSSRYVAHVAHTYGGRQQNNHRGCRGETATVCLLWKVSSEMCKMGEMAASPTAMHAAQRHM